MEFRILGSVEALRDRRSVNLGGVQTRRLLGLLLAHSGDVVVPDRIIDALWWSVDPPSSPERTVQSYVSRLRGSLGDGWVTRRAGGYLIEASRSAFDARLFAEAVKSSRGRPPAEKLATLATALEKWRGVPFGEFSEEPWAVGPVRRLRDLRATALENVFAARISLDGHREVVGDLEAAVAEYPEHAELVGQFMVALARSGSHAAALRTFHLHRRLLADESGLDPSPKLVDLERQILANDASVSMGDDIPKIRGYELIEPIGHGFNGTVYRARQPVTDRLVAVKVIRADVANDADVALQFEPRAQRIARFEHTNVNTLYDFWREAGGAYLVSRLLRGGDVAQSRLSHGPWTPERTTRLVNEVGGALAAGHQAGLVHGNIRDGNVLFDDAGNSYLSDYPVVASSPLGAPPRHNRV